MHRTVRTLRAFVGASLLALTTQRAIAQECGEVGTIVADRPGTLGSPLIVPKGQRQIETGWSMSRGTELTAHEVAATMLRVPLSCRVELRVATGGYEIDRVGGNLASRGMLDGLLALKVQLMRANGVLPYFAVFGGVTVPVGGEFSHRHAEPETNVSALWELPYGQLLTVYGGLANRAIDETREWERLAGFNWWKSVTSRAAVYADYSETASRGVRGREAIAGIQLFPNAGLQLDAFVGTPVEARASRRNFGFGIARRF